MEYFFNVGLQYDYENSKFHKSAMEIGYGKNERFGNDERIKLQLIGYLNVSDNEWTPYISFITDISCHNNDSDEAQFTIGLQRNAEFLGSIIADTLGIGN